MRALRIVGGSGVGKTALADAIADEAASGGWLVVKAPSFRIHSALPLFTARRVTQSLIDALGSSADHYRSGLKLDRDAPEEFEEAFLRIVEGVTLDHQLLLVHDDAQWADAESLTLIEHTATTLADRAIAVVSTERSDETSESAFALRDEAIALNELTAVAAIEMIRAIYPGVSDDVANAIVEDTRGRPADIVAVATFARDNRAKTRDDVTTSTRRVVARSFSLLDAKLRTFLQICALIDDPIELRVLERIWPKKELFPLVDQALQRYLVSNGDTLRFAHSSVLDGVLETIAMEIPLRQRIIDALKSLPSPQLQDYERIAKQSAACGDHDGERAALLGLADAATAKSLHTLATSSIERALSISPTNSEELIPLYTRLSQLYNVSGRAADAIRCCRDALARARELEVAEGLGSIAASLVVGLYHDGQVAAARDEITRYDKLFRSGTDRAQILLTDQWLATNEFDVERADRLASSFKSLSHDVPPLLTVRYHISRAFLFLRTGDEASALESVSEAERVAERLPTFVSAMPRAVRMVHALRYGGSQATAKHLESRNDELSEGMIRILKASVLLGEGALTDARDLIIESIHRYNDAETTQALLGIYATTGALQGLRSDDPAWNLVRPTVLAYLSGSRSPAHAVVMSAWVAAESVHKKMPAHEMLDELAALHSVPLHVLHSAYPITLVTAAKNTDHRRLLERIAEGDILFSDESPLNKAHLLLARGAAAAALKRPGALQVLDDVRDRFTALGARYFASLAAQFASNATATGSKDAERPGNTTRREREVAALVAEGLTNREIAEKLVLSERTVESHIASLFNKCNVSSRTQLATWYLRNVSVA